MSISRRSFLKTSVGGAAGISLAGSSINRVVAAPRQQGASWPGGDAINPDISDMRVVCMHDDEMCEVPSSSSFDVINRAVDTEKVSAGMDIMAMQLAQKGTPEEAWSTIFRSGREWSETKAAIKVNCANARNMPREAVVKKIADVLIDLGVEPDHIVVYDGHGDASGNGKFSSVCDVNDPEKIRARVERKFSALGGTKATTLTGAPSTVGPKDLVDGDIDILVNIAVHRGHDQDFNSRITLCLKNHYGTFVGSSTGNAMHMHQKETFIGVNRHELITGGDPVRQQLCIVDSLFAAKNGPFENGPDTKPGRIVMGTFAGAVDYCTVKKIREEVENWSHDDKGIATFLTDYGYSEEDVEFIDLTPTSVGLEKVNPKASADDFLVTLEHASIRRTTVRFSLPAAGRPVTVGIYDMKGSLVRQITHRDVSRSIAWDGMTGSGRRIAPGKYVVSLSAGKYRQSRQVMLMK